MNNKSSHEFTLGTANLGQPYGITNDTQYNSIEAKNILKSGIELGINSIDTSPDYGNAEEMIGESIACDSGFSITTKIPKLETYSRKNVMEILEASLERMKLKKIDNLLFHDPYIYKLDNLSDLTQHLLESGKVNRVGFSSYHADHIIEAKVKNPNWSVFQIPENILDQRFIHSKELIELKTAGNRIYARSAFLQGLLLVSPQKLPKFMRDQIRTFEALEEICRENEMSLLEICISYMRNIEWNFSTVIGAGNESQLADILNCKAVSLNFDSIATLPEIYLDPRNWSKIAK